MDMHTVALKRVRENYVGLPKEEAPSQRAILIAVNKRGEALLQIHGDVWYYEKGKIISRLGLELDLHLNKFLCATRVYTPIDLGIEQKDSWFWDTRSKAWSKVIN